MSLLDYIAGGGLGLAALFTIVQLAPIKIDPWSWIARSIGGALNKEVLAEHRALSAAFREHVRKSEERDAINLRTRILRFNDELLHDVRHTKEHFDQILLDITAYNQYCTDHEDFKNEMAVAACNNIKDTYMICMENHSFL